MTASPGQRGAAGLRGHDHLGGAGRVARRQPARCQTEDTQGRCAVRVRPPGPRVGRRRCGPDSGRVLAGRLRRGHPGRHAGRADQRRGDGPGRNGGPRPSPSRRPAGTRCWWPPPLSRRQGGGRPERVIAGFASVGPASDGPVAGHGRGAVRAARRPGRTGQGHGGRLLNAVADTLAEGRFSRVSWVLEANGHAAVPGGAGWAADGARGELDMGVACPGRPPAHGPGGPAGISSDTSTVPAEEPN